MLDAKLLLVDSVRFQLEQHPPTQPSAQSPIHASASTGPTEGGTRMVTYVSTWWHWWHMLARGTWLHMLARGGNGHICYSTCTSSALSNATKSASFWKACICEHWAHRRRHSYGYICWHVHKQHALQRNQKRFFLKGMHLNVHTNNLADPL